MRFFTTIQTTVKEMCKHFFESNQQKTYHLRLDTLTQMMSYGNVHAGIKILSVDDTQGLVNSAMIERMGGSGKIISIFGDKPALDVIRYSNYSKEQESVFNSFHWSNIENPIESDALLNGEEKIDETDPDQVEKFRVKKEKFDKKVDRIHQNREEFVQNNFDL
jgi:tRNA (adenine-N(1)-)-methyltransferase non-catalytic subunit